MAPLDFDALKQLHNSANDLLHLSMVQQALVHQREEKWVNDVSESSLRMLEVCGISKDVLLLVKEHLQELQFTLRRASIGDPGIEDKITAYNCHRKKLKKETLKCLKCLKGMKCKAITTLDPPMKERKLMLVVDVIREVKMTSISIVESLLSLISTPWLDSKSGKKSFSISKLVPMSLQSSGNICDVTVLQSANKRLLGVQMAIEDLEVELECMFRRLIHTRVLLLNILTN